jgi:hypothetical protein
LVPKLLENVRLEDQEGDDRIISITGIGCEDWDGFNGLRIVARLSVRVLLPHLVEIINL